MGFVIANPLIPQFKNDEEREKFISEHTPGFLRSIGFFGRDACGYGREVTKYAKNESEHRLFGDT